VASILVSAVPSELRHLDVQRKISGKKALNKPYTFTRNRAGS
jgi:hypothetical protein